LSSQQTKPNEAFSGPNRGRCNHHHYMSSANQGFRWYEIDVSYYLLVALSKLGVIWDVRRAPAHVVAAIAPTDGWSPVSVAAAGQ
jgi:hypothetical protein